MKAEKPELFSIITINLNNLDGLKKTHRSIERQTFDSFEWIVIDGNSSDETKKFLRELKDERYSWISEPDDGIYDAMNKGLERSKGDYVIFMNSGDVLYESNVLEKTKKYIEKSNPDLIYGDSCEYINEELVYKPSHPHKWIENGMFTHHQSIFYKRLIALNIQYDLNYLIAADYAFTCNFLKESSHISYIPNAICIFDKSGITSSYKIKVKGMLEQWKIGRDILRQSTLKLILILLKQLFKNLTVIFFPFIYRSVRYKKASIKDA